MRLVNRLTVGLLVLGGVLVVASQLGSYQFGETNVIPPNSTAISHIDLLRGAQILVESRGVNDSSQRIVAYVLNEEEQFEYSGNAAARDAIRASHMAAIAAVEVPNQSNSYLYRVKYDSTYYIVLDNSREIPIILKIEPQGYFVSITVLTPNSILAIYAAIPLAAATALYIYGWGRKSRR